MKFRPFHRRRVARLLPEMPAWVRKEDCPGCRALVDADGRYQPGFCGDECEVRRARDERIAWQRSAS